MNNWSCEGENWPPLCCCPFKSISILINLKHWQKSTPAYTVQCGGNKHSDPFVFVISPFTAYTSTSILPHSSRQVIFKSPLHTFSMRFQPADWLGHARTSYIFLLLLSFCIVHYHRWFRFLADEIKLSSNISQYMSRIMILLSWCVMFQYHYFHTPLCAWCFRIMTSYILLQRSFDLLHSFFFNRGHVLCGVFMTW